MKAKIVSMTQNPIDTIYNAFRICYAKNMDSRQLAKHNTEEDKLNFFMPMVKNGHESPLEHVSFTFEIEGVSRSLLAQLTRHRLASFSCQSQRYVDANNFDFVLPQDIENNEYCKNTTETLFKQVMVVYNKMVETLTEEYISLGIDKLAAKKKAQENARCILPNATTCNIQMTINLRSFRNFYGLRACTHAQDEIRELALLMASEIKQYVPFVIDGAINCGKSCFECINR